MTSKLYYPKDLYSLLKARGLSSGKMWMLRQERAGKLLLRRDPKGWRRVTALDIIEISNAFSPGGQGYWYWNRRSYGGDRDQEDFN